MLRATFIFPTCSRSIANDFLYQYHIVTRVIILHHDTGSVNKKPASSCCPGYAGIHYQSSSKYAEIQIFLRISALPAGRLNALKSVNLFFREPQIMGKCDVISAHRYCEWLFAT